MPTTSGFLSQAPLEIPLSRDFSGGSARTSQLPLEIALAGTFTSLSARVSQTPIEIVLGATNFRAIVSQVPIEIVVRQNSPIVVVTSGYTDLDWQTATLVGTVDANTLTTSGYFQYGVENPPTGFITVLQDTGDAADPVGFSAGIVDLEPGVTYFFRSVGVLANGEEYFGSVLSLTTSGEFGPSLAVKVSQLVVEYVNSPDPVIANVSQLVLEYVNSPDPVIAHVSSLVIEYVADLTDSSADEPVPDGEDLCAVVDDVVSFVSWQLASGVSPRVWFAETDLDDPTAYYEGWKPGKILRLDEAARKLAGTNWDYNIATFGVMISDDDYSIRGYLDRGNAGEHWYEQEMEVFFVTPTTRHLFGAPKRIATGNIYTDPSFDEMEDGMTVSFQCRDRIGTAMRWTEYGQSQVPRRLLTDVTLPGVTAENYGKGAPLPLGLLAREIIASGERPRGLVSAWWACDRLMPDTNVWRAFMVGGCAIQGTDDWFYDPSPEDTTASGISLIEQNLGDGTEWCFPGTSGYMALTGSPGAFEDIVGSDGVTRRWALAYGRGPKANLVASGTALLTWNGRGIESKGDSTGTLLTELHDQFALVYENIISVTGEGYTSGDWSKGRTFSSDNMPIFDYFSLRDVKSLRAAELAPLGISSWESAGILGAFGELIDVDEALARFMKCGDFRLGPNRFWQIGMWALNQELISDDVTPLLDQYDIHIRTFKQGTRFGEFITDMPYRYRRDYAIDGNWLQDESVGANGNLQTTSETSERDWGGRRSLALQEFHFMRNSLIKSVLTNRIMTRKATLPPRYVELEGSLCLTGAAFDVGKYVVLTHWRGPQVSGWSGRPLWILENTPIPTTRRVRLTLLDVYPYVTPGEFD